MSSCRSSTASCVASPVRAWERCAAADGRTVLLTDGTLGNMFGVRAFDGSPPVRLGASFPSALSADGKRVLVQDTGFPCRLTEVAVGPGETRRVDVPGLECTWAEYDPEGGFVVQAHAPNSTARRDRIYRVSDDGRPAPPSRARAGSFPPSATCRPMAAGSSPRLAPASANPHSF